MDNNEFLLKHYGVLGMKWGIRRDRRTGAKRRTSDVLEEIKRKRSQREREKFAKDREKVLSSPTKLASRKNRVKYKISDEEAKKQLEMFNLDMKLRAASRANINRGKEFVDMVLGYADTAQKVYKTLNSPEAQQFLGKTKKKKNQRVNNPT